MIILVLPLTFLIISTKKQFKTLEDVKGMKIRAVGGAMVDAMKAYGMTPMFIPMPDNYIAMQKGTVDGVGATWEAIQAFRLHEVGKYVTVNMPLGASYFAVVMNKKKWNSLPKDVQTAITAASGLKGAKFWGRNFFDTAKEACLEKAKKEGKKIPGVSLDHTSLPDPIAQRLDRLQGEIDHIEKELKNHHQKRTQNENI